MFLELAEEWLRVQERDLVAPENERRHINHLKALWRLTEKELRPSAVKWALADLLKPRGPLSGTTVNKVQSTGRRIIRDAMENDRWTGPNPFEVVKRQKQKRVKHRDLSLAEARALLAKLSDHRRREAYFMLYLGARPGEMKALQKCDVDAVNWTVTIRRSNERDQTKTGKERVVPVPEGLKPHLLVAIAASPPDCELVFPSVAGGLQRHDVKLTRVLRVALRAAGLITAWEHICRRKGCGHRDTRQQAEHAHCPRCGFKLMPLGVPIHVRFYDLRHSAATLHRDAGADPLAIQTLLGHTPENTTDSLYTNMTVERMRPELSKLVI